jgi:hypothetical protein
LAELQVFQRIGGYLTVLVPARLNNGQVEMRFHVTAVNVARAALLLQLPVRIVLMDPSVELYFRWVMTLYGVTVL